jgi:hypothetical protein
MKNSPRFEPQLAKLADGTLDVGAANALTGAVAGSPELSAALAEQELAVSMVRSIDDRAPASLYSHLAALTANQSQSRRSLAGNLRGVRSTRRVFAPVLAFTVALAAALVVFIAGSASQSKLTVLDAAHLALASATLPPPAQSATDPMTVRASIAGVSFPYWSARGWRTTGARSDVTPGRDVRTVFYTSASGTRVGYAIAAGAALPLAQSDAAPRSATSVSYGVRYELLDVGGAEIVTWLRDGHTCVLASRDAGANALLRLARWSEPQRPR